MFDPPDPPEPDEDEYMEALHITFDSTTVGDKRIFTATVDESKVITSLVHSAVQDAARQQVDDWFRAYGKRDIELALNELVKPKLADLLENGVELMSEYGQPKGRITLKEVVGKLLSEKVSEGYNRDSKTRIERLIEGYLPEFFKAHFAAEVESAQKKFRAQVDELLQTKIAEGLRTALGLR